MNFEVVEPNIIDKFDQLPSLPQVVTKVLALMERDDTTADDLAQVISKDSALSLKLLKLINSPFYGFPNKIISISRAAVLLGLVSVRNMVLGLAVYSALHKEDYNDQILPKSQFMAHSLACATCCRLIAKKTKYRDPEEAFVAGLLHDIGRMILVRFYPEQFQTILAECVKSGSSITAAETSLFGFSHAHAGAWLLRKWNIPDVQEAVYYHHNPFDVPVSQPREKTLAVIVYISDVFSKIAGIGLHDGGYIPSSFRDDLSQLHLSEEDYFEIFESIVSEMEFIKHDFGVDFDFTQIPNSERDIVQLAQKLYA